MTPFSTLCFGLVTICSCVTSILNYKKYDRFTSETWCEIFATITFGAITTLGIMTLV